MMIGSEWSFEKRCLLCRSVLSMCECPVEDRNTPEQDAYENGVIFYCHPKTLAETQIDPLLVNAVFLINKSGWCWTAESCQGHPDGDKPFHGWGHNTEPMLRLACRKQHLGHMLSLLTEATQHQFEFEDDFIDESSALSLHRNNNVRGDWAEVIVYVRAHNVWYRNLGIRVYENFAKLVNEQVP